MSNLKPEIDELQQTVDGYKLKLPLLFTCFSLIGLFLLLIITNPDRGPVVIVSFLVSILLSTAFLASLLIQCSLNLLNKGKMPTIKLFYTSVILAIGITFLISLKTLNQLELIDILLSIVMMLTLIFYIQRRL